MRVLSGSSVHGSLCTFKCKQSAVGLESRARVSGPRPRLAESDITKRHVAFQATYIHVDTVSPFPKRRDLYGLSVESTSVFSETNAQAVPRPISLRLVY